MDIPASVERVGEEAYRGCGQLRRVIFEAGSRQLCVGDSAFAECENLEFVSFPESLSEFALWFGPSCDTPFFAPGLPCAGIAKRRYKLCAAAGFVKEMGAGASASADVHKGYAKYAKGHVKEILDMLGHDLGALRWLLDNACITGDDAVSLRKSALDAGLTEQARLLEELAAQAE